MHLAASRARAPLATAAVVLAFGAASTVGLRDAPAPSCDHRVAPSVRSDPATSTTSAPPVVSARGGLAASWYRICELATDGTVRCLGNNEFGELGDGTHTARRTWTQVAGLTAVVELALGGEHSCALLRDTTVRCWGANPFGQLGDGTHVERTRPVAVEGLSGVVQIAAGAFHTCARLRSGDVLCWGGNLGGMPIELDPATTYRAHPTRVGAASGAASLVLGHEHSFAMLANQHVVEWGSFANPDRPHALPGLGDAGELVAGWSHACSLTRQGLVRCWGSNSYGQLGAGTAYTPELAVPVEHLPAVTQLAIGRDHTCARTTDGGVACWGANEAGQVGATPGEPAGATLVAGLHDIERVACGWDFSCARSTDGRTRCWGNHAYVPATPGG